MFAARLQQPTVSKSGKPKRESAASQEQASGSPWAPGAYMVGLAILLAGSMLSVLYGVVHPIAACFLPWAGFFWAKLFFWKSVLKN